MSAALCLSWQVPSPRSGEGGHYGAREPREPWMDAAGFLLTICSLGRVSLRVSADQECNNSAHTPLPVQEMRL